MRRYAALACPAFLFVAFSQLALGAAPPARPDLVVESVGTALLDRDCVTAHASGTVSAVIRNDSLAAVAAPALVLFFEDRDLDLRYSEAFDQRLTEVPLAPMAALERVTVTAEIGGQLAFVGAPILAWVDSRDTVSEEAEGNARSSAEPPLEPPCPSEPSQPFEITRIENYFDNGPDWSESTVSQPARVAHLTDDNGDGLYDERDVPTVVVAGKWANNFISIRGDDATQLAETTGPQGNETSPPYHYASAGLAIGNLDADAAPELVGIVGGGLAIFDHDLEYQWVGEDLGVPNWGGRGFSLDLSAPVIANLDGRGPAEVIFGHFICNNRGKVLAAVPAGSSYGGLSGGSLPAVADIDLDGDLEIIYGGSVYSFDGTSLRLERQIASLDGWTVVANFDPADAAAELAISAGTSLQLYDVPPLTAAGTGSLDPIWEQAWQPPSSWLHAVLGMPGVADLTADGIPEILIGSGHGFGAIDVTNPSGQGADRVLWEFLGTGFGDIPAFTSFDLDGDGILEVLYASPSRFKIINGSTGALLHDVARGITHRNFFGQATVADIDNDGHVEVLVPSGGVEGGLGPGLWVFGNDTWAPARSTWNQLPYTGTNVNDDGTIPRRPAPNWLTPAGSPFNDYNCQHAPSSRWSCAPLPDLTVSQVAAVGDACGETVEIEAVIGNGGSAALAAAIDVTFYSGDPVLGNVLDTVEVAALPAGASTTVSVEVPRGEAGDVHVVVDAADDALELEETNNTCRRVIGACDPTPVPVEPVLALDTPSSLAFGRAAEVSGTLVNAAEEPDAPIEGVFVEFTLGTATCRAVTDAAGVATCWLTTRDATLPASLSAASEPTSRWLEATDDVEVEVARAETTLVLDVATTQSSDGELDFSVRLLEDGARPVAGAEVTVTGGAASDDVTTGADGRATGSLAGLPGGSVNASASFAQTATHAAASAGPVAVLLRGPQVAFSPVVQSLAPGATVTLTAILLDDGRPLVGRRMAFERVSGPSTSTPACDPDCDTDASGRVEWGYVLSATSGTDVNRAWLDLDSDGVLDAGEPSAEATVNIGSTGAESVLTWSSGTTANKHDAVAVVVEVEDAATDDPLPGEVVSMTLDGVDCRAVTDANGLATCWYASTAVPQSKSFSASFAGSPSHDGDDVSGSFALTKEQTALHAWTVPVSGGLDVTVMLRADAAEPLDGEPVRCCWTQSLCTTPANTANGGTVTVFVPSTNPVTCQYAGDADYLSSQATAVTYSSLTTKAGCNPYTSLPAAPTSVSATILGDGAVEVQFTRPAAQTCVASPVGYLVKESGTVVAFLSEAEAAATTPAKVRVTQLANGTSHSFVVQSVGVLDNGGTSSSASATPRTMPAAPEAVDLAVVGLEATVEWTEPSDDGGGAVSECEVTSAPDAANWPDATSPLDGIALTPGVSRWLFVRCENAAGTGPWALAGEALVADAPSEPLDLRAVAGDAQVTLSWLPPADLNGGDVDHYLVQPGDIEVAGDTLHHVVTGLANGTLATFTVAACNAADECSGASGDASATPRGESGPPQAVEVERDFTSLVVEWTAPASNGGAAVLGYLTEGSASTTLTRRLTGLPVGVEVEPEVSATNAVGDSDGEIAAIGATPAHQPEMPTGVTVEATEDGDVEVSWTAPLSNGGSSITGYTVTTLPPSGEHEVGAGVTELLLEGLTLGVPHVVFVRAENALGLGAESDPSDPVTPHTVPCPPRGLAVAISGDTKLRVTWTSPECDGGEAIGGYDLAGTSATCDPIAITDIVPGARQRELTDDDGLEPGCEYDFTLVASNVVGDSTAADAGPVVVATLPAVGPTIAGDPTTGDGEATVEWSLLSAGADSGFTPILGYRVCPLPPGDVPCIEAAADATQATILDLTNG